MLCSSDEAVRSAAASPDPGMDELVRVPSLPRARQSAMAAMDCRPSEVLTVELSLSVLVHFAGAVHIPARVARGHHLAALTDVAVDWLCVPASIPHCVGLATVVARWP